MYANRVGETYALVHNPQHRWYYFHLMTPDECLLIKSYDSAGDGIARLGAHAAFDGSALPGDTLPRQSIELQTVVFF